MAGKGANRTVTALWRPFLVMVIPIVPARGKGTVGLITKRVKGVVLMFDVLNRTSHKGIAEQEDLSPTSVTMFVCNPYEVGKIRRRFTASIAALSPIKS